MRKILVTLFFSIFFAQQVEAKNLCLGTFSSFSFNHEGGDLLGVEIKVVPTKTGMQAAIQFSEGEPGSLVVVPVVCDGIHFSLNIPKDDGGSEAFIKGVVSKARFVGELVYISGGREKLTLPRRKGYWD